MRTSRFCPYAVYFSHNAKMILKLTFRLPHRPIETEFVFSGSRDEVRRILEQNIAPPAPLGLLRDWQNSCPFMGVVDASGLSIREKAKLGLGWPANIDGTFVNIEDRTMLKLKIRPTKEEKLLIHLFYVMFFIGLVFLSPPIGNSTPNSFSVFIAVSAVMLFGTMYDHKRRAERVSQLIRALLSAQIVSPDRS